jgi:hypothetical protein
MKKPLALLLLFGIVGCSDNDMKLTLDCELDNRWNPGVFEKKMQYIWYESTNSLQGKNGTVTPYKYENDFEITFERKDTRGILYNRLDNSLTILNLDDSESRWGMVVYQCKEVKK